MEGNFAKMSSPTQQQQHPSALPSSADSTDPPTDPASLSYSLTNYPFPLLLLTLGPITMIARATLAYNMLPTPGHKDNA
jgi:hypothetical protein